MELSGGGRVLLFFWLSYGVMVVAQINVRIFKVNTYRTSQQLENHVSGYYGLDDYTDSFFHFLWCIGPLLWPEFPAKTSMSDNVAMTESFMEESSRLGVWSWSDKNFMTQNKSSKSMRSKTNSVNKSTHSSGLGFLRALD